MAKTQHYYNSLPECSIIDYEVIPLPEAALLWCGVKHNELNEEMKFLTPISQSIYSHPYIPCLEKKTRVLTTAVNNGILRAVREHGEGGENGDHVAYGRRHFWIKDLKQFISENYPNDRPKTIFHDEELKPIVDIAEYERMSKEYQKLLAENTNLKTALSSAESKIRDSELALQSMAIQVQQAKSAQQDTEERLEKGREHYKELLEKYKKLKIIPDDNLNLDNSLYLLGEILNAVKSKTKKWTQGDLIDDILLKRQNQNKTAQGLEKRKIEDYFSAANKKLKSE